MNPITPKRRLPSKHLIDKPIRYTSFLSELFNDWGKECGEDPAVLKQWLEARLRVVLWEARTLWIDEHDETSYNTSLDRENPYDTFEICFRFRKNGLIITGYTAWSKAGRHFPSKPSMP